MLLQVRSRQAKSRAPSGDEKAKGASHCRAAVLSTATWVPWKQASS